MRILATGGAGYVGSRVVDALLAEGHSVTVLDDFRHWPHRHSDHSRLFHIVGDIRDARIMASDLNAPEAIVHMAAIVGEKACDRDEAEAWGVNVGGTSALLSLRLPMVLFSTCSNYGVHRGEAAEDAKLKPLSLYARSKVAAEDMVLEAGGCVLRLATVCGPTRNTRYDLFVNDLARAAACKRAFEVYGMKAWRPYVHVGDVGLALAYMVRKELPPGAWNLVAENLRKSDVVDMARRNFPDLNIVIRQGAKDLRDYRVSGAKIAAGLGIRPAKSIEDAFNEIAAVCHVERRAMRRAS